MVMVPHSGVQWRCLVFSCITGADRAFRSGLTDIGLSGPHANDCGDVLEGV